VQLRSCRRQRSLPHVAPVQRAESAQEIRSCVAFMALPQGTVSPAGSAHLNLRRLSELARGRNLADEAEVYWWRPTWSTFARGCGNSATRHRMRTVSETSYWPAEPAIAADAASSPPCPHLRCSRACKNATTGSRTATIHCERRSCCRRAQRQRRAHRFCRRTSASRSCTSGVRRWRPPLAKGDVDSVAYYDRNTKRFATDTGSLDIPLIYDRFL
jgi:hypothetical protein